MDVLTNEKPWENAHNTGRRDGIIEEELIMDAAKCTRHKRDDDRHTNSVRDDWDEEEDEVDAAEEPQRLWDEA